MLRFWFKASTALALAGCLASEAPVSGMDRETSCDGCHLASSDEYRRSRMAVSAITPAFLREWQTRDRAATCLACHAPSGAPGVGCKDCHRGDGHPFGKVADPGVCAGCHEAPGEITLRSYHSSVAAQKGELCADCHLEPDRSGHEFLGPYTPGFLDRKAFLGVSLRRDAGRQTAIFDIRHRAGHALPGGTTGRAVWLSVEIFDASGQLAARHIHRFGWFFDPDRGWHDNTLPPDARTVVELPLGPESAATLRAELIYQFIAGNLLEYDEGQVVLDQKSVNLGAD